MKLGDKNKEDAIKFQDKINKSLPGLMELEYEGYNPRGLFVAMKTRAGGAKKKYALLNEDGSIKIRGFETVRRNWSKIAKELQEEVLSMILAENDAEGAFNHVKKVIRKLIVLKMKDPNFIYNSIYYLKSIPKYFELKEKFNLGKCMAGYYSLNIDPYGYISICNYGPNLNVKGQKITKLWKHKKYKLTRIKIKNCKTPCMMLCYQRFDLLEFIKLFFGVKE